MKKINLTAILSISLAFFCVNATGRTSAQVKISAWGMHRGGQVVYKYRVQNLGTSPIDRIFIGFYPPTSTDDGAAELTVAPYYPSGNTLWLPPSVSQSPAGWGVNLSYPEKSSTFALDWIEAGHYRKMRPKADSPDIPIAQNPPNILPPGATWDQFSVTLPKPDYAYVQGHAYMFYGNNELTVQLEKGDATPPNLTVTLTPTKLWPPNGKLVPIVATIIVKDNYDPAPDIRLESITCNELCEAGDIRDASLGVDDRQFMLKAERKEKNKEGRIYTVIYSATDASGNKSIATATVTVHRDEREHESRMEEESR